MRGVCAWCKRRLDGERGRWLAALLVSALALVVMRAVQPVTFYDNDDLNICWALAGYRSGAPSFSHPFLNCITAAFVSLLYTLFPRLPWWLAVQSAGLWLGMAAFLASLLKAGQRRGLSPVFSLGVFGLTCAALFFYPAVLVTFTLTSAVLGMGAVSMCAAADREDAPRTFCAYLLGGAALLAGSFLIRQSAGICVLCFYAGALAYQLLQALLAADKPAVKRVLLATGVAALAAAVLTASNSVGRSALQPDGFLTFEEARASYMDYPHDTYQENPSLYASVGWDDTLTGLVDAWFYMDERVNAETLTTIVTGSAHANLSAADRLRDGRQAFSVFLGKYPLAGYWCVLSFGVLAALLIAYALCGRGARLHAAIGGCLFLGAAALLTFLCMQGRMNLRTLMTVLYPWMAAGAVLTVLALPAHDAGRRRVVSGAALLVLCAGLLYPSYKIARTVLSYESEDSLVLARSLADYAMEHPGNVYIRDVYAANSFDATTVYPSEKPVNLMDWGGCDMYTAARAAQMERNGLTDPYAGVFLRENVYYVCEKDGAYLPMLAEYMAEVWDAPLYEIADELPGGIAIVKFIG